VIAIFLGSYSVIGMSLESPAAMATPARDLTSTSIARSCQRKGLQLQFHPDVYRLIQWFVQNDFSFDNDCRFQLQLI
jgi:hypothetical protein